MFTKPQQEVSLGYTIIWQAKCYLPISRRVNYINIDNIDTQGQIAIYLAAQTQMTHLPIC